MTDTNDKQVKPTPVTKEEIEKDEKEIEKSQPNLIGEQGELGDMPNPEEVNEKTVSEVAEEMGEYEGDDDSGEKIPEEVGMYKDKR